MLTSCYLINHMHSFVINNQVLHCLLYPYTPLYSFPSRVFGSAFFVHDLSFGLDKLSTISLKCVFLGYTRSKKDYRYFQQYLIDILCRLILYFLSLCLFFSYSSPKHIPEISNEQIEQTIIHFESLEP